MKKQKPPKKRWRVQDHLESAKYQLCQAGMEDGKLEEFTTPCEDGHKLTLGEVHTWLTEGIKHFEETGERHAAMKTLETSLLRITPS